MLADCRRQALWSEELIGTNNCKRVELYTCAYMHISLFSVYTYISAPRELRAVDADRMAAFTDLQELKMLEKLSIPGVSVAKFKKKKEREKHNYYYFLCTVS